MAEYNLGRVGLVIKGEYNNTTQYKKPGQVLQKKSNTNYDTEWVNVASGGTTIITSATEPTSLKAGDQWHKEY